MLNLNLIVLRSGDVGKARRFYEALGMQFTSHRHGSGPEHLAHEDECGVFEIYPAASGDGPDKTGLGFEVSDLELIHNKLAEFRPNPIAEQQWGRTFVVRDPDGRRVEIKQK